MLMAAIMTTVSAMATTGRGMACSRRSRATALAAATSGNTVMASHKKKESNPKVTLPYLKVDNQSLQNYIIPG